MKWTYNNQMWTSGNFTIIQIHRYFKLYYNKTYINQFNTLQLAKDEAQNYKV